MLLRKPFVIDSSGISIPRGERFAAIVVEWPDVLAVTRQRVSRDADRLTFDVANRRSIRINTKGLQEPDRFIADIEERIGYQIPFV